eukprot:6457736-Pyramimonas_sp.AAC.1
MESGSAVDHVCYGVGRRGPWVREARGCASWVVGVRGGRRHPGKPSGPGQPIGLAVTASHWE